MTGRPTMDLKLRRRPSAFPKAVAANIGERGSGIAVAIAAQYGLTLADIRSNCRERRLAWPRQHVMSALRAAGYTECAIGRFLNRDASTVSTGHDRHQERAAWAEVMTLLAGAVVQPDLFARAA